MSFDQIGLWDSGDEDEQEQGALRVPKRLRSLKQAREFVQSNLNRGVRCPCCDQYAKRYRRKLNSGMARALIALHRLKQNPEGWIETSRLVTYLRTSPELSKLCWWCLAESAPHKPSAKRVSGLWKLTELGASFVLRQATVQSHAITYDNILERLDGEQIGIDHALGDKFDYTELMSPIQHKESS